MNVEEIITEDPTIDPLKKDYESVKEKYELVEHMPDCPDKFFFRTLYLLQTKLYPKALAEFVGDVDQQILESLDKFRILVKKEEMLEKSVISKLERISYQPTESYDEIDTVIK